MCKVICILFIYYYNQQCNYISAETDNNDSLKSGQGDLIASWLNPLTAKNILKIKQH